MSNGQHVQQGAVIGFSSDTGYTNCGPHLHFAKQNRGGWWAASQPVTFLEYPSGVPSGNLRSQNHDTPTLFAHGYILGANTSPFLQLRKNDTDLRNFQINPYTPPPLDPWGIPDGWNDDASSIHVPESMSVRLYSDINYAGNSLLLKQLGSCLNGL